MSKNGNSEWADKQADIQLLLDSGLLFEANRQIFHLVGLALTARKDDKGQLSIGLKDLRQTPEQAVFTQDVRDACRKKYNKFMREYGFSQINKRTKKLGWTCQWVPPEP